MSVEQAVKKCYKQTTATGFLYEITGDFPSFQGHFEGYPVLPAVCEISLCNDASSRLFNKSMEVQTIKRGKFINPVLPNCEVEVRLSKRPDGWYFAELVEPTQNKKLSQLILRFVERKL